MKKIKKLQTILQKHKSTLQSKYHIAEMGIFGSYVRNEQEKSSDVDILVSFSKPIGLFKFLELEEELTNILGIKVDLVSKKALKPKIGEYILKKVMMI